MKNSKKIAVSSAADAYYKYILLLGRPLLAKKETTVTLASAQYHSSTVRKIYKILVLSTFSHPKSIPVVNPSVSGVHNSSDNSK